MFKLNRLRVIFIWFFILGQTQLISILRPHSRLGRILCAIADIIYLLILTALLITQFKKYSETSLLYSTFITNAVTFIVLFPNFAVIIENWVRAKELEFIVNEIEESLDYFETFVNIQVRIADFARHYYKKMFFVTVYLSLNILLRLFVPADFVDYHLIIIVSIAGFYEQMSFIHITFYINLQGLILNVLNDTINPVSSNSLNECILSSLPTKEAMFTIHRTKIIHQKIWKISESLNKRFGYFLFIGLVSTGVFLVRNAMAIFIFLTNFNHKAALRK